MEDRAISKPRLEAEPAYENAHLVARDLLQRIEELLCDLPAPGGEITISWPLVAAMVEVNQHLASIVAMLDGTRR